MRKALVAILLVCLPCLTVPQTSISLLAKIIGARSGGKITGQEAEEIGRKIIASGLRPHVILAIIEKESGFDPGAISPKGAIGLMQIKPITASRYLDEEDLRTKLLDPVTNVEVGLEHIGYLKEKFGPRTFISVYLVGEYGNINCKAATRYTDSIFTLSEKYKEHLGQ